VEATKRRAVEATLAAGRPVAYVGDGRGDLEAAALAAVAGRARGPTLGSVVFARDALADVLTAAGLPFTPFETLDDVRRALACE
jgi:2-hydroxy-3-keto-5-methylthiopentenyl-1-phosphate phosphatase